MVSIELIATVFIEKHFGRSRHIDLLNIVGISNAREILKKNESEVIFLINELSPRLNIHPGKISEEGHSQLKPKDKQEKQRKYFQMMS